MRVRGWVVAAVAGALACASPTAPDGAPTVEASLGGPPGLPVGPNSLPPALWDNYHMTGVFGGVTPSALPGRLRLAARRHMALIVNVPRRMVTGNGEGRGPFSIYRAKRAVDAYRHYLPPDTARKYVNLGVLRGWNLLDDVRCSGCYDGEPPTVRQAASLYAYANSVYPFVPWGIRITADWLRGYAGHPWRELDFTVAQYHTRHGDVDDYFDRAARDAAALGLKVALWVNVKDCHGANTSPCTATELRRFGMAAVRHPANCDFGGYQYWSGWRSGGRGAVWDDLVAAGRARSAPSCRRVA